jgi:uncharacterized protein
MPVMTIAMAAAVGVALGMLGGGGSILMVPLVTYIGGLDAKQAIATSLLVVGTTSAIGAIGHARAGRVRWGVELGFGVAGMAGPYGIDAAAAPVCLMGIAMSLGCRRFGLCPWRRLMAAPT